MRWRTTPARLGLCVLTYKFKITGCMMLAIYHHTDVNYDLRVVVFLITDEKDTPVCTTLFIVTHYVLCRQRMLLC